MTDTMYIAAGVFGHHGLHFDWNPLTKTWYASDDYLYFVGSGNNPKHALLSWVALAEDYTVDGSDANAIALYAVIVSSYFDRHSPVDELAE